MPNCHQELSLEDSTTGGATTLGDAAHICGEQPGSPRYDPSMTDRERNSYPNLIYMCPTCHVTIDTQPQNYPTELLLDYKENHVRKIKEAIICGFEEVGFAELEYAATFLVTAVSKNYTEDFRIIPPEDKIKKNSLGSSSRSIIKCGLALYKDIQHFIETVSHDDLNFPEKLKYGFLEEYSRLRRNGHTGDDLFDFMCSFAQRGLKKQSYRNAGLAILCYLFFICEVFEK